MTEGKFFFLRENISQLIAGVIPLRAGDMYRVQPHVPHGVRCRESALIVQARA